jgi:hypothetical protein
LILSPSNESFKYLFPNTLNMPASKNKTTNSNLLKSLKSRKSFKALHLKYVLFIAILKRFFARLRKWLNQKVQLWHQRKCKSWGFWKPKLSFLWNTALLVFVYGAAVNYICSFFWAFPLNVNSVLAFGFLSYFIKVEFVDIIIKIRGPKNPIIMK